MKISEFVYVKELLKVPGLVHVIRELASLPIIITVRGHQTSSGAWLHLCIYYLLLFVYLFFTIFINKVLQLEITD